MTERGETIDIQAGTVIDRPLAEVRAQYGDMDHHMRNDVHPGIRFTWLPSERGERRLSSAFRLLGILQRDTLSLHDEADGTLVIDHLDGPNRGTKIFHRFTAEASDRTRVDLTASVPVTTGRALLGPLFRLGVRKILEKALREDKRDLERGAYRPGAASGNVERACALLEPVAERVRHEPAVARDLVLAFVECAALAAVADGVVEDAERDALQLLTRTIGGAPFDAADLDARLATAAVLSSGSAVAERAHSLGARLAGFGLAREGLTAAALVAQATKGVGVSELALLQKLAEGAALEANDVERAIEQVDRALHA